MKKFASEKIARISTFLSKRRVPLKDDHEIIDEINLDFEDLSNEILELPEEDLEKLDIKDKTQISDFDFRLGDEDLQPLLSSLEGSLIFKGMISIKGQSITDKVFFPFSLRLFVLSQHS